jgi:WD40 repeat protein
VRFIGGGRNVLVYIPLETRIYDLAGRELFRVTGEIWRAVSPDGRVIVTQRSNNTLRLWSVDGRLLATLSGHAQPITMAEFSPDGTRLVTVSTEDVVRLWNRDGRHIAALPREPEGPMVATFSPDGTQLLTAGPGPARLWNRDGREVASFGADLGRVASAAFSTDGRVAVAGGERGAEVWRLEGGATRFGAEQPVERVIVGPDGKTTLTLTRDGATQVWDARGDLVGEALGAGRLSPDGDQFVTLGVEGGARLRDLTGRTLAQLDVENGPLKMPSGPFTDALFSPDGARLMTVAEHGPLRLWDRDGVSLAVFKDSSSWGCVPARGAFSPDGRYAVTVGVNRVVQLWDLEAMTKVTLVVGVRTWYWLTVINPTLLFGTLGMWVAATRLRAPLKRRLQNQRTLLAMWPAWAAAHALAVLLALSPFALLTAVVGLALGRLLWGIAQGYLPEVRERRWLLGCGLGWLAGFALAEAARLALFPYGLHVDTRLIAVPLAGCGLAIGQWLALRGRLRGSGWLAVAAVIGWLLGAFVTGVEFTSGGLELALIQGAVSGAVAGAALVWVLLAPADGDA